MKCAILQTVRNCTFFLVYFAPYSIFRALRTLRLKFLPQGTQGLPQRTQRNEETDFLHPVGIARSVENKSANAYLHPVGMRPHRRFWEHPYGMLTIFLRYAFYRASHPYGMQTKRLQQSPARWGGNARKKNQCYRTGL